MIKVRALTRQACFLRVSTTLSYCTSIMNVILINKFASDVRTAIGEWLKSKHAFRFLCVLAGSLVNTSPVACYCMCGLTCIHAIVSWSPWGHGSVAMDKRHCQQWTSSLFWGFLPNPFIQDLFLWICKDGFISHGLWSLSGMPSVRPGAGR